MDKLTVGRDLIRKAVQMTTIISKDKTYEDRLWKLACDYVRKAKETIPEEEWTTLSEFEQRVLRNGVPDRSEFCFFNDQEEEQLTKSTDDNYPPKPSTWDSIHRAALSIQEQNQELTRRIYTLEREKSSLEDYKEQSRELRLKYEQLDESHDMYRKRVQEEQQALNNKMRKAMEELEAADEHKQESQLLYKELETMKEKMLNIQRTNYDEMNRLRIEIDSINHEREILSDKLETAQTKLVQHMNEIENLNSQIKKYQEIFMFVLPTIPDDIQQQLSTLI
jgi:DNA repair exonuclease SbcCD ATPase subunit